MCVREPAADGDGVLGMENVRGGRVVDDDGVFEVASNLRKVLSCVSAGTGVLWTGFHTLT